MKFSHIRILLIVVVSAIPMIVHGQEKKPAHSTADLGWFAGCWQQEISGGRTIGEQWTKPEGMLLGLAKVVRDGKISSFEYLRIIEKDSEIFYVALPSGQKEGSFKLTSLNGKEAVFENPEHDFPQRITYRLAAEDNLKVRAEAMLDGKWSGFDQDLSRIACD